LALPRIPTDKSLSGIEETLDILYHDEDLVAVYKPAGLLVHRSTLDRGETRFAMQILRDQLGQRVHPLHRLDKATSGLLLFALHEAAASEMGKAFQEGRVQKQYRAIVRGHPPESGRIDYPLVPERGFRKKKELPKPAQEALTDFKTLGLAELPVSVDRYPTARFAEVELYPHTGRRHQLRRHLAHLRHPIIGDTRHGDGKQNRFFRESMNSQRLLLVALSMKFEHPISKKRCLIECAPDPSYQEVVERLGLIRITTPGNR